MRNQLTLIAEQRGWAILPATDTHMNRLQVRSESSSNLYTVSQTRKNRIWQCECLGYRRNRTHNSNGDRWCKHLAAVVPVFEAVLANPDPAPARRPAPASPAPASNPGRPAPAPARRVASAPKPAVIIIRVTANVDTRLNGMVPAYCGKLITEALMRMPGVNNLTVTVEEA